MKRLIIGILLIFGLAGCASGNYQKGLAAAQQGDYSAALAQWRPLAERGDADAQYQLGLAYRHGRGVKQDYPEAVRWFRLGEAQFHPGSLNQLGEMYEAALGLDAAEDEALKRYRDAAALSDRDAWANLGHAYESGVGVEVNYDEARRWYERAAERGAGMSARRSATRRPP